jgi:carboxymethylenebutenolidase
MISDWVTYAANGGEASGYLVTPDAPGEYMGVVVIQEWWGVNAHIQDVTKRMAGAGAVAIAPDLYHGLIATEPDEARKQVMELDRERAMKEIQGAVAFLKAHNWVSPKKIGVIGFCMGGGLALFAGAKIPDVGAVVAFYGGSAPKVDDFAHTDVAVLNIVGEKDQRVLDSQRQLDVDLRMTPIQHELVVFPGCDHAFFNDTRPEVYQPGAAQDAWARAIQWLRAHLR